MNDFDEKARGGQTYSYGETPQEMSEYALSLWYMLIGMTTCLVSSRANAQAMEVEKVLINSLPTGIYEAGAELSKRRKKSCKELMSNDPDSIALFFTTARELEQLPPEKAWILEIPGAVAYHAGLRSDSTILGTQTSIFDCDLSDAKNMKLLNDFLDIMHKFDWLHEYVDAHVRRHLGIKKWPDPIHPMHMFYAAQYASEDRVPMTRKELRIWFKPYYVRAVEENPSAAEDLTEEDGEEEAADAQEEAGAEQERDAQNKYADDLWSQIIGTTTCLLATMTRTSRADQALIDCVPQHIYETALALFKKRQKAARADKTTQRLATNIGYARKCEIEELPPEKGWILYLAAAAMEKAGLLPDGDVPGTKTSIIDCVGNDTLPLLETLIEEFESLGPFMEIACGRVQSYLGFADNLHPMTLYEIARQARKDDTLICTRDLKGWFRKRHEIVLLDVHAPPRLHMH